MIVPLTVSDFIERAVQVYGQRVGVVDEPDQPAPHLGELTYSELGELALRQAAKLDELGLAVGDRVAVVSHNSTRLLASFFGVSGSGRVLVPINFRLSPEEIRYIVEHSGARVLLFDPELEDSLKQVDAEFKFVLGDDENLYAAPGITPRKWDADENATACINYTSGTTARPKGVQVTHRNIWTNAVILGLHAEASDRDVYLHTLPSGDNQASRAEPGIGLILPGRSALPARVGPRTLMISNRNPLLEPAFDALVHDLELGEGFESARRTAMRQTDVSRHLVDRQGSDRGLVADTGASSGVGA